MSAFGRAIVAAARLRGLLLDQRGQEGALCQTQERSLRRLLHKARQTQFGRKFQFSAIGSAEAYMANVPLHRYDDFKPWFERALEGEPDVTWPGRIKYFGMSSGTTAGNKYLPISADSIRQQQRGGFDPLAAYLRWTGDAELLAGKAIMLGGSTELESRDSGALVGDNTGIMARHMPKLVASNYLPTPRTRAIANWDEKIDAVVAEALDADVRVVAGTPSWFAGLFERLLGAARARGRKASTVHDIWPNLRLLTGGGVNFEPYRALIRSHLARHVPYVDVYNATEGGIMGVQDCPDDGAMRMLPDNGLFYEFVPIEELTSASPSRFPLWRVETGVVYALAVTTMSGIYSYLLGDCIRFVSTYPHRFVFEGRSAAFLNVTGEHVSQGELERAAQVVSRKLGAKLREFTVTADVGVGRENAARHRWLIEFEYGDIDVQQCAELIDLDLSGGNDDYRAHRTSRMGLLLPQVDVLRPGAFDDWMRSRGKLGGQHKVPRVLLDHQQRQALEAFGAWSDVRT